MSIEQALDSMGRGPLTAKGVDSMRVINGYRHSRYLKDASMYDVVYARELPGDVSEPLLQDNETPAVFRDGKLLGWGWRWYVDSAMVRYSLPSPLKGWDTVSVKTPPVTPAPSTAPGMMPSGTPQAPAAPAPAPATPPKAAGQRGG